MIHAIIFLAQESEAANDGIANQLIVAGTAILSLVIGSTLPGIWARRNKQLELDGKQLDKLRSAYAEWYLASWPLVLYFRKFSDGVKSRDSKLQWSLLEDLRKHYAEMQRTRVNLLLLEPDDEFSNRIKNYITQADLESLLPADPSELSFDGLNAESDEMNAKIDEMNAEFENIAAKAMELFKRSSAELNSIVDSVSKRRKLI